MQQNDCLYVKIWWNGCKKENTIHWIKKEQLLKEKSHGGMGFRYVDCLNDAMLMKHLWGILSMPDIFLSKVIDINMLEMEICSLENLSKLILLFGKACVMEMFKSRLVLVDGRWIWKLYSLRVYTVKSGYGLAYRWNIARGFGEGEGSDWESRERI